MSNFNYCCQVNDASSSQLLSKIKSLLEKVLHFWLKNYEGIYKDLLEKSGYPNINLSRQRTLCIEFVKL